MRNDKQRPQAESIVAIAASGSALPNVFRILAELPEGFGAPVCLAVYGAPCFPQRIDLEHMPITGYEVRIVRNAQPLERRTLYIAPAGRALQVTLCGQVTLVPLDRQAVGVPTAQDMIVSSAQAFGTHAAIVVLSGCGDFGSAGLPLAKACGATIFSEDPETAELDCMPKAAVATGRVDFILPVETIARKLAAANI